MQVIQGSKENWCLKHNQKLSDFVVNVMCFEDPKPKHCSKCQYYRYKKTKVTELDCSKMPTAIDCLKAQCDYAEAADCQFICNKPKEYRFGKSTDETFSTSLSESRKGDKDGL